MPRTADRVLPWRRSGVAPAGDLAPVLSAYREKRPKGDTSLILRAYQVAEAAHEGQQRKSGEPFITHPLAVAGILAGLGLDDVTLASALLHDAVEDTGVTVEEVEREFGGPLAAGGPLLRRAVPEAVRRDRADGGDACPRARHLPGPGARAGAGAADGCPHRGRGHRPAEAPVLHLREDGRQGQGVRRDLRPR